MHHRELTLHFSHQVIVAALGMPILRTIGGTGFDAFAGDTGGTRAPVAATAPDTTAPAAPSGVAVSADGTAVTGTTEPGATVTVKDAAGETLGTAVADENGDRSEEHTTELQSR